MSVESTGQVLMSHSTPLSHRAVVVFSHYTAVFYFSDVFDMRKFDACSLKNGWLFWLLDYRKNNNHDWP